jgi:uncharacterized membrane protein
MMIALAVVTRPASTDQIVPPQVLSIVQQRCVPCHSATPTEPGYTEAANGIFLDTEPAVLARRQIIGPLVKSGYMPFENATAMTEEERALVVKWAEGR